MSSLPGGRQNPITVHPGKMQYAVDPCLLLPSRGDLDHRRLVVQRGLLQTGQPRFSPIQVTPEGVIWDGHHAIRVAADANQTVDVLVVDVQVPAVGLTILQLPVR